MEIIIIIQAIIIIFLAKRLLTKNQKAKEANSLINGYDNETQSITYTWKLDSARNTKLRGFLTLKFDPEEINQLRINNPFAAINNSCNNGVEANMRKMYFFMLNNPRTLMHCAEIVKYINRECSKNRVDELDKLQFVLDFVQEPNVKYHYDHECAEIQYPKEYIRFPDETLYDRQGDCDCKSFLAATLFHLMGYNVLFLISYKLAHAAICVEYDDRWKALLQNAKRDVTTEYEGRKYVYCETTSDHFRIGGISPEFTVNDFEVKIELRG